MAYLNRSTFLTTMIKKPIITLLSIALLPLLPASARAADESALIAIVESSANAGERADACRRLLDAGSTRCIPALAAALDEDVVGHAALHTLERLPQPEAAAALRDALPALTGPIKASVADALGWRKDPLAVPLLTELLRDQDETCAATAALALGRIGDAAACEALTAAMSGVSARVRQAVIEALPLCAEERLQAGDAPAAIAIYDRILAADPPPAVRAAALYGLLTADEPRRAGRLNQWIAGTNPLDRRVALQFLPALRDGSAILPLIGRWESLPVEARIALLENHRLLGNEAARLAISAVQGGEAAERLAALRVMGEMHSADLVPVLAQAAFNGPRPEQTVARNSLASISGPGINDAILISTEKADSAARTGLERIARNRGNEAMPAATKFRKIKLTGRFQCEGVALGDFNRDGHMDVAAGWQWFAGPDFKQAHDYTAPPKKPYNARKGYSDYFVKYVYDFNNDGWLDILLYSWPGQDASWYQNPGKAAGYWKKHVLLPIADNESPQFGDMTGDGKPELICHTGGSFGFGEIDWANPTAPAVFRSISPADPKKFGRFNHGYGFGDINGDGRADIIEKNGWWEQPEDYRAGGNWKFHNTPFIDPGGRGGAQMLVHDVNGDGRNDVISSLDSHGYGLVWFEQLKDGSFRRHMLVNTEPEDNPYGVKFTQIHALELADVNGDGLMDFVTGKRFWAHGPDEDAEPGAPAVIYWFELKRGPDGTAEFIPHLVDDNSGVGTQVTAGDLNGDGLIDIISGNKKGVSVFMQQP
jgi:HEAT repeat protein